ncbi:MAG: M48 family metalloprotease [Candidatus Omnitrophica bacterium]|nr:M48 family metalloprotease [Candidatus Omnitrophota bacterium]
MKHALIGMLILVSAACAPQTYYNVATQRQETYYYSEEREVAMGKSLSREVARQFPADTDLLDQQRLRAIGAAIVAVSDRKNIEYTFTLIDKDEVNAFAIPGGYVYVFRGLWDKIRDSDDKIAAVLAHEIAHITARHTVKRLQDALGYGSLAILAQITPGADMRSRVYAQQGIRELLLSYSREEELEADMLAAKYLQEAGFSPQGMLDVLALLQQTQRARPAGPAHVQTHPYIPERQRAVRQTVNRGEIEFNDYINSGLKPGAPL